MTDMSDKPAPGLDYSAASADIHPGTGADYVERQPGASVVNERDFVDIPSGALTDCATNTLVASFVNEKELGAIRAHQEETLRELTTLKEGLTALNRKSAAEYASCAADYVRAARLAGELRSDLNDITKRVMVLKEKLRRAQGEVSNTGDGSHGNE